MIALLDVGAGPEIVTWPMLLAGLGVGALASQLGAVTVSAVPDEQSGEVGGLQNTVTNLGASIATALTGAVLISVLTTTFLAGLDERPPVADELSSRAEVELSSGIPFVSDAQLEDGLAGGGRRQRDRRCRRGGERHRAHRGSPAALAVLALITFVALWSSRRLPTSPATAQGAATPT